MKINEVVEYMKFRDFYLPLIIFFIIFGFYALLFLKEIINEKIKNKKERGEDNEND